MEQTTPNTPHPNPLPEEREHHLAPAGVLVAFSLLNSATPRGRHRRELADTRIVRRRFPLLGERVRVRGFLSSLLPELCVRLAHGSCVIRQFLRQPLLQESPQVVPDYLAFAAQAR